jgi:hypothetical protein
MPGTIRPLRAGCAWRWTLTFLASLLVLSFNVRDVQAWTAASCSLQYPGWGKIDSWYNVWSCLTFPGRSSLKTDRGFPPFFQIANAVCNFERRAECACNHGYWTVVTSGAWCCNTNNNLKCAISGDSTHHGSANWGQWGSWGSCSTSCGSGTRSRRRRCDGNCSTGSCRPVGAYDTQSQGCSAGTPRSWSGWAGWSSCNCGDTRQTRSRSCQGSCGSCSGSSTDSRDCKNTVRRYWTNWGSWGGCGTSCGVSTQWRSRNCVGDCGSCSGSSTDSSTCYAGAHRSYTSWSSWGACSAACGTGIKRRNRSCEGCYGDCSGDSSDSASCVDNVQAYWSTWSGWGACSSDCGPGTRFRQRQCSGDCEGSCPLRATEDDASSCEVAIPRSWALWGPWGACEGCGTGSRSRTRPCLGTCEGTCEAGAFEPSSEPCPADEPAAWSSWTSYSTCSVVCGDGLQTRTRTCEGELGMSVRKTCSRARAPFLYVSL